MGIRKNFQDRSYLVTKAVLIKLRLKIMSSIYSNHNGMKLKTVTVRNMKSTNMVAK